MRTVTGFINAAELVENTDPRFGAIRNYLPAVLLQSGKEPRGLLFTKHQIQEAGARWDANPEDQLPFEPEQVRFERLYEALITEHEKSMLSAIAAAKAAIAEEVVLIKRRALRAGVAIGAGAALIVVGLIRVLL